jgi:sec-independent protein translocase protein TatB
MIDFGFDKIAIIGAGAWIVIGPKDLPRVARTVGTFMGKARRYVADVKAEVNRSIELEELQKAKQSFEEAARDVGSSVSREFNAASDGFNRGMDEVSAALGGSSPADDGLDAWAPPPPHYQHPGKHWRLKRGAMPQWYKQRHGVRGKVQSAAARVARHRPRPTSSGL